MKNLFKQKKNSILLGLFTLIYLIIFRNWFSNATIFGGDFPFFYNDYSIFAFPYGWSVLQNHGLGGYAVPFLWGFVSLAFPIYLFKELLPWVLIEKVGILFPYLAVSIFCSWYSFSKIFKDKSKTFISSLVFLLNTFVLMFVGGGLVVTGLAYALIPLSFIVFQQVLLDQKSKNKIILGIILGMQITFDLRIAFLTGIIFLIYFLLSSSKKNIKFFIETTIIPSVIATGINAYWLLPLLIVKRNPLEIVGQTYTGVKILDFLSFTKFENAISLMHPNWPENIFGKVTFLQPEFLILPILAFLSLLFLKKEEKKAKDLIIFAGVISIIGIFMAKGVNDPFGQVYEFFYKYISGFQMFRDSSKWFVLIAFGYSILIPFTLSKFWEFKNKYKYLFITVFTLYFIFLLRPAFTGNLTKLFKVTVISNDYLQFKNFVVSQSEFFRTGWFPTYSSLIYGTSQNVAVSISSYFNVYDQGNLLKQINSNKKIIQESGIKYIGVTNDSQHEIFLTDRKYDDKKYQQAVKDLENISWLKKVKTFGKIVVFEVPNPKDHFWSTDPNLKISYKYINPTKYLVSVKNAKKDDLLVFSESFDPKWVVRNRNFKKDSTKFDSRFNSFILPKAGDYSFEAYYTPQDYVNIGVVISLISLVGFTGLLFYKK